MMVPSGARRVSRSTSVAAGIDSSGMVSSGSRNRLLSATTVFSTISVVPSTVTSWWTSDAGINVGQYTP